jgi:hypothetical protein
MTRATNTAIWDLCCDISAVLGVGIGKSSCGKHEEGENGSHFGKDGKL